MGPLTMLSTMTLGLKQANARGSRQTSPTPFQIEHGFLLGLLSNGLHIF